MYGPRFPRFNGLLTNSRPNSPCTDGPMRIDMPKHEQKTVERLPARAYFVASDSDKTVLVALNVRIEGRLIRWFDTAHERLLAMDEVLDHTPSHYVFRRPAEEGGDTYTLVPLTLDMYQRSLKGRFRGPQQDINSEEDLFTMLEKSREDAW